MSLSKVRPMENGAAQPLNVSKWVRERLIFIAQNRIPSVVERARFKLMLKKHFKLIGDKSVYAYYYISRVISANKGLKKKEQKTLLARYAHQLEDRLSQTLHRHLQKIQPLDPNDWIITLIYALTILVSFVLLFSMSIKWGFLYAEPVLEEIRAVQSTAIAVFLLEAFVNLNVGYYRMGKLIDDRKDIFQNYRMNSLKYDIVAFASLLYSVSLPSNSWVSLALELPVACKIFSLQLIRKNLEAKFLKYDDTNPYYQVSALLFKCILVSHVVCIFWHLLNQFEYYYEIDPKIWLNSYYWSINTMITGGSMVSPS